MKTHLPIAFVVFTVAAAPCAQAAILAGPITNAANSHIYFLLDNNTWSASESEAKTLGGHLVTINDAAENQWVIDTFIPLSGVPYVSFWIGLNDVDTEGQFVWASGEPVTFTFWYPGEPNDAGPGEDFATIRHPSESPPTGSWNDLWENIVIENPSFLVMGVVEVPPPLSLKIHRATEQAIELEFKTEPGLCYQLEQSVDLATWLPLGPPVSAAGNNNLVARTENTPARFYRLATMRDGTPGLIAYYRLDGSAADCTTKGNHGFPNNVTFTTNRFGRATAACRFAGTSDSFIRVPHSPSLELANSFTLAAWVNFEVGGSDFPRIINKFACELTTGEAFRETRRLFCSIKSSTETLLGTPTELLQAGRWHFVTAMYDGTMLTLYVDAAIITSTVASGGLVSTPVDLNIGRNAQNGADNYKGLIDDVRIYRRALSAHEVLELFTETE